MKKLIFCLGIILAGGFTQVKTQSLATKPTQAEQLVNVYFNQEQIIEELKTEFNISDEIFQKYNNQLMKFFFQKRVEFIKAFINNEQTIYTAQSYFENIKNKLHSQIETYIESSALSTFSVTNPGITTTLNRHNHSHEMRAAGEPCTNPDFEMCDFTNWNLVVGSVPTAPTAPYSFQNPSTTTSFSTTSTPTAIAGGSGNDQHYICTGGTDNYGYPMVYPGGTCTAEIGDFNGTGNMASQISQTYLVSSSDAILILNYAVVLEDPGHALAEQPYFRMRVYDQSGASIACGEFEAVAGDGSLGWQTGTNAFGEAVQYKPWTTVFIPMAPFIGQNVTVEFTVGDCSQGGHAGYAYVDASCDAMALNMTAQNVCAGQPLTITGPAGAASYLWNTGATTQAITTSTAGTYSVLVTPVTGSSCAITLDTTITAYPNPNANFNDDAPACIGELVNFNDLSNVGGGSTIDTWAWDFGDGTTSTLQDPSHAYATSGTFNVTLTVTTNNGCSDTEVNTVTINNGGVPTINPAGPFCSTGAAVVLTSNIAGGTWSATCGACINSATGSFNPTLATVGNNTITYTTAGACNGSDTEVIQIESIGAPVIADTDIDCFGNCIGTITMTATGATQFSNDGGTTFQATGNFTALCANTYNLVAQTAIGCQVTGTATISEPLPLLIPTSFNDENCGACDGDATVTPADGTSPYTIAWSNGAGNVTTATGLCVGGYTVTVTDDNGCIETANITISGTTATPVTINPAGPFCSTEAAVILTTDVPGGTWSATCGACINSTTGSFDPTLATVGNNTITYTTPGPCISTDTEVILVESIGAPVIASTDIDCFGNCIGTITMSATGATQFSSDGGATFQATGNFTALCANTYNLVAESAIGCQVTGTATIVEPLQLLLPTAFTDETCFGSCDGVAIVAPQQGTSPYSYSWSNGGGNVPTIGDLCVGVYTVTVTDDNGCVEVANITVSGPAQVLITSIVEVDETCTNSCDGSITITAPLATQFSIDGGATFQASNVFTNVCSGTYNVVVQDATPCQATGTATITTPNPLNIIAGPNSTICIGQSATVSATANGGTAPITLIWDNGLPTGSPHTVTPALNTTYTVFAQDGNGCQTSPVQITVTLNPILQVSALSDQDICPGESANISATATGGNGGPYTYVWNDGAGNILNGANQTVSPAVTTTYTVTATDNCGTPAATDAVTITVNPLPVVTFNADNLQGCTPVSVNFTNTTNAALTGSCFWDFGDGTTSATCDPNHVYTVPGCYTVTLTVTSPDGCVASATVSNMICVFAYPVAEFSFGPQPTDILQTEISFTNETTLGVAYEWDFAGLGTSQSTNPTFVFPNIDPGTYPVCLSTVSIDGCMDTVCHDVIILDLFLLYVPNTFTPDFDGINDFFFPVIDGYDPLNFNMMIFNRWGELIFETEHPDNKWDGTHKGLMSQEDTYVWKINTKDMGTGKKREFIGHVNLLK